MRRRAGEDLKTRTPHNDVGNNDHNLRIGQSHSPHVNFFKKNENGMGKAAKRHETAKDTHANLVYNVCL